MVGMMNNEKGFAVVTTVFIMVSFLSVALLVSYPLVKAVRNHSANYLAERDDYRMKKALFGEMVDQCGTRLSHTRGLYGDYPGWGIHSGQGGGGGKDSRNHEAWPMSRRCLGYGTRAGIAEPEDYKFADGFWSGYHGKRYVRRLPVDEWGYKAYRPFGRPVYVTKEESKEEVARYDDILTNFYLSNACGGGVSYTNYTKRWNAVVESFSVMPFRRTLVDVKDYSRNRQAHDLDLTTTGSQTRTRSKFFFSLREGFPQEKNNYTLYRFELYDENHTDLPNHLYSLIGQRKLMILVKENGRWTVRDTKVLVNPPNSNFNGVINYLRTSLKIYRINFYG